MGELFESRIDIPEDARVQLVELLNRQLADTTDLYSQVKQAHWNVKGSDFIQLHELFDDIAAHLLDFADMIAERATTLGGQARGTVRQSAASSSLSEYPEEEAFEGMEAVSAVADQVADYANKTRGAMDESEKLGDLSTSDLFTEVSRQADKDLWFLEAHLQSKV